MMKINALTLILSFLPVALCASEPNIFAYIRSGSAQNVKREIQKNKNLMFATDEHGNTVFILAARYGHNSVLSYLNDEWPQWTRTNKYGENALHAAIRHQHPGTAMLAISLAKQDPDIELEDFINRKELSNFSTPLHLAAKNCDQALYTYLVQYGANPDLLDKDYITPATILKKCPPLKKKKETEKLTPAQSVKTTPLPPSEVRPSLPQPPAKGPTQPPASDASKAKEVVSAEPNARTSQLRPVQPAEPTAPELEEPLDINSML